MVRLQPDQKIFVVQQLACRETPTEVVKLVKEQFGLEMTKQAIEAYDPYKWAGKDLSADLKAEFDQTRKWFDETIEAIPVASKAYRLKLLQKIIDTAGGNSDLKMRASEQAAKELGGLYTNRKEITGAGGGPIQQESTTTIVATEEQMRQAIGALDDKY